MPLKNNITKIFARAESVNKTGACGPTYLQCRASKKKHAPKVAPYIILVQKLFYARIYRGRIWRRLRGAKVLG